MADTSYHLQHSNHARVVSYIQIVNNPPLICYQKAKTSHPTRFTFIYTIPMYNLHDGLRMVLSEDPQEAAPLPAPRFRIQRPHQVRGMARPQNQTGRPHAHGQEGCREERRQHAQPHFSSFVRRDDHRTDEGVHQTAQIQSVEYQTNPLWNRSWYSHRSLTS